MPQLLGFGFKYQELAYCYQPMKMDHWLKYLKSFTTTAINTNTLSTFLSYRFSSHVVVIITSFDLYFLLSNFSIRKKRYQPLHFYYVRLPQGNAC